MQNSSFSGQRGVRSINAHKLPAAAVRSVVRPVARTKILPGNATHSPAPSLGSRSPSKHRTTGQQYRLCQTHSHSSADPADASTTLCTPCISQRIGVLCWVVAALVCLPLLLRVWTQVHQQSYMLALAGVLLPLQSHHARQSLKKFQHALQAAAAVEAETEEPQSPEPEDEQPNDNTIIETGAELGNVQTPASVWLPYSTSQNGKQVCTKPLA